MLGGINYWDTIRELPSQLEMRFAIFANFLKLDDHGNRSTRNMPSAAMPPGSNGTAPEICQRGKRALNHGSARSTNTRNLLMRADSPFGTIREAAGSLIPAINIAFMRGRQAESRMLAISARQALI